MVRPMSQDEAIMRIIIEVYNAIDAQDIAGWSLEEARKVVDDQVLMDKQHGLEPLPYDPDDFYETIRELISQDSSPQ